MNTKIFKNPNLPYVELRYNKINSHNPKLHIHDTLTIVALKSGAVSIFPQKPPLKFGSIALINQYEAHYGKVLEPANDGVYVLYLDINWCRDLQNSLFGKGQKFYKVHSGIIDDRQLHHDFCILADILFDKTLLSTKAQAINQFATQVFCDFCDIEDLVSGPPLILQQVKTYLEQNLQENITIEDLAAKFQLSPFHLLRLFKKEYGLPPHAYCLNLKVHLAKKLLDRHYSVIDAALEAGFFDQSHFHHAFKRVFSITPRDYQSNFIQD